MMQEFTQEMKNMMRDTINGVHTAIPGRIASFDAARCAASVLPYGKYKKPDGSRIDYPQINDAPVIVMQGSGRTATIAFPIKPGDECLMLFSEQALDVWRSGAESNTDIPFDLTNAVVLVGLFSKPNVLVKEAVDQDAIIIDRNGTRITLRPDNSVEITGNVIVRGNLTVEGTGVIGSVVVNTHTHISADPGVATSDPR